MSTVTKTTAGERSFVDGGAKRINIAGTEFSVCGDENYLKAIGRRFEPSTVSVLRTLCDTDSRILDVGANIGLTACAFSVLSPQGKIAAVEPVSRTFGYLQANTAALHQVSRFNYALGREPASLTMQGGESFLAGAFISDRYQVDTATHFSESVAVRTLDDVFESSGLDRLDVIKVDVEGYELEVIEGGKETILREKPLAFIEMNHWCLNVFRRISIPEFRERLMAVFPHVFAIHGSQFVEYSDERNAHRVNHGHILARSYSNLVAGFDRDDIIRRLSTMRPTPGERLTRAYLKMLGRR